MSKTSLLCELEWERVWNTKDGKWRVCQSVKKYEEDFFFAGEAHHTEIWRLVYRRSVGDALRSRCREYAMHFFMFNDWKMFDSFSCIPGHNRLESRVVGSIFECNNYTRIDFQVYDLATHLNLSTMYRNSSYMFLLTMIPLFSGCSILWIQLWLLKWERLLIIWL